MSGFDAKEFLRGVPDDPGVYRMFGAGDVVLYVGKPPSTGRVPAPIFAAGSRARVSQ